MNNISGAIGKLIVLVGVGLVGIAMAMLYSIWQTINQIMTDPTQVPAVKFLMDKIAGSDQGIFGKFDDKPFEVHLGEPLRYMLYVIMGAMALGILTRIFAGLVYAGGSIIRLGTTMRPSPADDVSKPV